MSESLKAQRERAGVSLCYRGHERGMEQVPCHECMRIADQLRELQRQAMEEFMDWVVNHEGWRSLEDGHEPPIEQLLDSEGA